MATIPLFDFNALKTNMDALGPEMLSYLKDTAEKFVKDNKSDALVLGDENVKAILGAQFYATISLPELPENATAEQLAQYEAILTKRDQAALIIASAQKANNESQNRVIKNAEKAAMTIGVTIGTMFLKSLLGA